MVRRALLTLVLGQPLFGCFDELGSYETAPAQGGGAIDDRDPTSTASESSSSSAPTGAGGGSAPTGAESCTNGADDDADGLIDCEDADCGGYYCIPAPVDPAFAGGPQLLLASGDNTPCSPAFPDPGVDGLRLIDAPSPCACACASATGQACQASATLHASAGCGGASSTANVGSTCIAGGSGASVSAVAEPAGGSCMPSSVAPVAPTFEPARTCSTGRGGGCAAGFVCARPPAPDGSVRICFERPGDVPCEDHAYSQKMLVFDDEPTDTRSCSGSCSCQAPQGGACDGSLAVKDGSCSGPTVGTHTPGQPCTNLASSVATSGLSFSGSVIAPGACTPNHKTETGGLEGTAHTLCCADGL